MGTEARFYEVERDGPVIIWRFHHPPRNLATLETSMELVSLVEAFDKDPGLRVGIVTSAVPGMFIQHFDVSVLLGWGEFMRAASPAEVDQQLAALPPPRGIAGHSAKPVICAINGPVEGGGCEMALGCDFRFIASDAFMGQPEVSAGIIPGGGGTQLLARLVGVARAMELCMTGRRILPEEALRLGLVTAVCPPEALMPTVLAFAKDLAAKPPLAIANIKRAIYEGSSMALSDGLLRERDLFFQCLRSDEAIGIMRLYVEAGQDREKMIALLEAAGGDAEKVMEMISRDTDSGGFAEGDGNPGSGRPPRQDHD